VSDDYCREMCEILVGDDYRREVCEIHVGDDYHREVCEIQVNAPISPSHRNADRAGRTRLRNHRADASAEDALCLAGHAVNVVADDGDSWHLNVRTREAGDAHTVKDRVDNANRKPGTDCEPVGELRTEAKHGHEEPLHRDTNDFDRVVLLALEWEGVHMRHAVMDTGWGEVLHIEEGAEVHGMGQEVARMAPNAVQVVK
jgi:hypothetical protein